MRLTNNLKLLCVLIACLLSLNGCAYVKFQNYKPVGVQDVVDGTRAKIVLTDKVMLRAYITCDPIVHAGTGIGSDPDNNPKYCSASANLFGLTSIAFEFVNDELILRNGEDQKKKYEKLNTSTIEGGREQFAIFDYLGGVYDYWRGVSTGFLLDERPRILELLVPDVKIDGKIYKIPVLKYQYWENTEFRHILQGG